VKREFLIMMSSPRKDPSSIRQLIAVRPLLISKNQVGTDHRVDPEAGEKGLDTFI
jgi:hypothetical protein